LQDRERNSIEHTPRWALNSLLRSRLGHLACSTGRGGKLLVIPICYAFDGSMIYSAIDEKPKSTEPLALRRVSNIIENPKVCFIVDEYCEDWRRLQYLLVHGTAAVLTEGMDFDAAISLLRRKYRQYETMRLEGRPIIEIKPMRIVAWRSRDAKVIRRPSAKGI